MTAIDCFIVAAVAIFGQTVAWAADQVSQPSDGTTATVVSSSSRPVSPVLGGITLPVPRVGDSCTYSGKIEGGGIAKPRSQYNPGSHSNYGGGSISGF